eukprot:Em0020g587a
MADDRRITNVEAFERYVAKFRSNTEAARRFLLDEGLDTGTDDLGVLNRWVYRIRSLRNKWARLSKGQKSSSDGTKKAFSDFQQETFFIPDGTDHDRDRRSASIEPTVAGSSDDGNDVQEEESTSKITPLDELSPRHTKRRTDALFSLLKEEAEEQKITTTQLLGFLLHRENYIHDRAVAAIGLKLFHKETITREISLDEGLFMLSTYKLGRTGYSSLRQELKSRVELPPHYRLMQHKDTIMPKIGSLDPLPGVSISVKESVQLHFRRLIQQLGLQPGKYTMTVKEGLDGSGRHSVYDQKGNVQTHNMIVWMWVALEVYKDVPVVNADPSLPSTSTSANGRDKIWNEPSPSSPDAARPILLVLGKEDKDLLHKIVPPVDAEMKELQSSGVKLFDAEREFYLMLEFHRTMNDGKMQKLLLGRGGAFCILCAYSDEDAVQEDNIKEGFEIGNVDIEALHALYDDLAVDGEVQCNRGDYSERVGLTQSPISTLAIQTFPILHALLRGLDYCLKIVYKLKAGVTAWIQNSKQKERVDVAKRKVQEYIKTKTGMTVDKPDPVGAGGTTTTGNIARNLLFDPAKRQVLVECVPEKSRKDGRFTPSMHQILAHSAALIDANDSTGLGVFSEEPLEHNKKNLRKYRELGKKNFSECQSFRCFDKAVD